MEEIKTSAAATTAVILTISATAATAAAAALGRLGLSSSTAALGRITVPLALVPSTGKAVYKRSSWDREETGTASEVQLVRWPSGTGTAEENIAETAPRGWESKQARV